MTWVPTTAPAVGDKVPVDFGLAFGAWTSYSPTLGNWTTGNGSLTGSYAQVDNLVLFRAQFTFGTTSAAASSIPTLTLPVTAASGIPLLTSIGVGTLFDTGTNTYEAVCRLASTTTVALALKGTNGQHGTPSTTSPFTWTTGDSILAYGLYEAA